MPGPGGRSAAGDPAGRSAHVVAAGPPGAHQSGARVAADVRRRRAHRAAPGLAAAVPDHGLAGRHRRDRGRAQHLRAAGRARHRRVRRLQRDRPLPVPQPGDRRGVRGHRRRRRMGSATTCPGSPDGSPRSSRSCPPPRWASASASCAAGSPTPPPGCAAPPTRPRPRPSGPSPPSGPGSRPNCTTSSRTTCR